MVYLAEQQRPIKRQVALKVIKPGMDTRQVVARFEAERQALALLDHPNIARVFDAGATEAGRPYFVMELIRGLSIIEYCDRHKLDIEKRLELFLQVCEAIQYAHQKGIIHRDIKPSNILVSVQGEKAVPVVIDFGVAKAISHSLTERTLFTEQGQFLGTPEYMSPEQAEMTAEQVDTRSDIYSLGVVLYELLAGTLPFDAQTLREGGVEQVRRTLREEEPKTPSTRLSKLGEQAREIAKKRDTDIATLSKRLRRELEWIPLKAVRKEPDRRYKTASELADDIRNYLNGNPLIAGPESASYRLRKAVKRHHALVTGAAAVLLVLLAGIVVSTVFALGAIRARKAETAHRMAAELASNEAQQARETAEKQREAADLARAEAEQAKTTAESQKARAELARQEVEARSEKLRVASYHNNIRLADKDLADGNVYRATRLLESCPSDLLGWEWYYLVRICRSFGRTYSVSGASPGPSAISSNDRIAFCGDSGNVVVWDIGKASEMPVLSGHTGRSLSVAFSPDGHKVVSGSDNGMIKVWDLTTRSCISTVTISNEIPQPVQSNQTSKAPANMSRIPEGNLKIPEDMLTCAENFKKIYAAIKQYEKDKGKLPDWLADLVPAYLSNEVLFCPNDPTHRSTYSPDPKLPCSYSYQFSPAPWLGGDGTTFRERKEQQVKEYGNVVPIVRCDRHDSGRLLNLSCGGQVYWSVLIWERMFSASGGRASPFGQQRANRIQAVAVSSDGRHIIWANSDGEAFLQDALSRKALAGFGIGASGGDRVDSIAYRPDGKRILTRGAYLKLWDANGVESISKEISPSAEAFSADSRLLAYFMEESLHICDSTTGQELHAFPTQFDPECAAFSPDSKYIVAGDTHGKIKVWDTNSGREELAIQAHAGWVKSVAFNAGANKVISVDENGAIGAWEFPKCNLNEPTIIADFQQPAGRMSLSPDCKRAAIALPGGTIRVLNAVDSSGITTLDATVTYQPVLAFSLTGKVLACTVRPASTSKGILSTAIEVWDLERAVRTVSLEGGDSIIAVAFDPNDELIASVRRGGIDVWHLSRGAKVRTFTLGPSYISSGATAFHPNGKSVCVAGGFYNSNVIAAWDLATRREKWHASMEKPATAIAFSPDGRHIASGDEAGMVELWDAETGHKIAHCYHGGELRSVGFSQDGMGILSGGTDGTIKIWDTRSEAEVLTLPVRGVVEMNVVAFSPDGASVLAGCSDGKIRRWDSGSADKAALASYFRERGLDHDQRGDYDLAIQALGRAVQLEPGNPQNVYHRGLVYREKRKYEKAIADFNAAIEHDADNPDYRFHRGDAYYETGRYDLAIANETKAVETNPQNALWLNSLAWIYATCPIDELRNGRKAVELATKACKLTEWSDADNIGTLAAAYSATGDFKSAVRWQERANTLYAERYAARLPSLYTDHLKSYQSGQPHYDTRLFCERNLKIPKEMQTCAENFKKIYAAIKQYEKEKGKLPDWLSDLVPRYLGNEVLFCPNDPNHQTEYSSDPKLPCSYSWEFSATPVPQGWDPTGRTLNRDWKSRQVKIFGDIVPMVRCGHHDECLNLAFGGQLWWSPLTWEFMIKPDYDPDELRRGN
jgi:WD40 repeat protein